MEISPDPPAGFILTNESIETPSAMTIFVPRIESSISALGEILALSEMISMPLSRVLRRRIRPIRLRSTKLESKSEQAHAIAVTDRRHLGHSWQSHRL